MRVSIIIPVLDSNNDLKKLLDAISCQTFQDFEVVIVDASEINQNKPIAMSTIMTTSFSPHNFKLCAKH